jgi:hypothetical protein
VPDNAPLNQRNLGFNRNPCTPAQESSNWSKVGDTINNIQEQITEVIDATCETLLNCDLTEIVCTSLEECDNLIDLVCEALAECDNFNDLVCAALPECDNFNDLVCAALPECDNLCDLVEACLGGSSDCDVVRACIYDPPFRPPGASCEDVDYCWDCLDVVEDIDVTRDNHDLIDDVTIADTVVTSINFPASVVTSVTFDEEECVLSVTNLPQSYTTENQSYNAVNIEYVTDVDADMVTVFAATECPP